MDIEKINKIIKPKVAQKAIRHVIKRVEEFNSQYFPFEITKVGIGGSSLRGENPKDIDLFIEAHGIRDRWNEWWEFKKCLNSNICSLGGLAYEISLEEGRATIDKLIASAKDDLLALGFKKSWIENWFHWVRISDIRWGLDRGLPIVDFSGNDLLSRFIKEGWRGKRLEIHVTYFDPDGNERSMPHDVPFITIWRKEEGIVIPTEKDLANFLMAEQMKLLKLLNDIIETLISKDDKYWDVPEIYRTTIWMIKEKEEKRFSNLRLELTKLALAELIKIKELSKVDSKINSVSELNTILREHLKRFAIIGHMYEKMTDVSYYFLHRPFKMNDIYVKLAEILPKRLRRYGYVKKDVIELLNKINLDALANDLEKIRSEIKKKEK